MTKPYNNPDRLAPRERAKIRRIVHHGLKQGQSKQVIKDWIQSQEQKAKRG